MTLQTKLLILILAVTIGFASGWTVKGWNVDSNTLSEVKSDIAMASTENKKSDEIIEKRDKAEAKERIVYRTIYKEIPHATDDRVCFTSDSLSLWNKAIEGADTPRQEPDGKAGAAKEVGATDREILYNANENFETCNRNARNHNALIDKLESLDGKMCYCGGG